MSIKWTYLPRQIIKCCAEVCNVICACICHSVVETKMPHEKLLAIESRFKEVEVE